MRRATTVLCLLLGPWNQLGLMGPRSFRWVSQYVEGSFPGEGTLRWGLECRIFIKECPRGQGREGKGTEDAEGGLKPKTDPESASAKPRVLELAWPFSIIRLDDNRVYLPWQCSLTACGWP
jgi:hypothetical protein